MCHWSPDHDSVNLYTYILHVHKVAVIARRHARWKTFTRVKIIHALSSTVGEQ